MAGERRASRPGDRSECAFHCWMTRQLLRTRLFSEPCAGSSGAAPVLEVEQPAIRRIRCGGGAVRRRGDSLARRGHPLLPVGRAGPPPGRPGGGKIMQHSRRLPCDVDTIEVLIDRTPMKVRLQDIDAPDTASGLKVRRRRARLARSLPSRRTTRERLRAMGAETRFAGVQSAQRGEGATHGAHGDPGSGAPSGTSTASSSPRSRSAASRTRTRGRSCRGRRAAPGRRATTPGSWTTGTARSRTG